MLYADGQEEEMSEEEIRCSECQTVLREGDDREVTEDAVFCRPCYLNLVARLQQAVAAQGADINYPMALLGGLLGGVAGVLVWWGFTVLTGIAFGLVAVVIGFTVGKGVTLFSGNRRSQGLQIMAVIIAVVSFAYATYLVNRTFVARFLAEQGHDAVLPLLPDPALFIAVIRAGFGLMDLVFFAIVIYEAWKIPAPFRLNA
jgi:hypothetical protein